MPPILNQLKLVIGGFEAVFNVVSVLIYRIDFLSVRLDIKPLLAETFFLSCLFTDYNRHLKLFLRPLIKVFILKYLIKLIT
ncbi:MAG: hypothetical protein AABZ13_08850 [Planctomycetota bacterium]